MAGDPGELAPGVADKLAVIDTCALRKFALIDALWVLESHFGCAAAWTEAARHELRLGLRAEPELQRVLDLQDGWLGDPLRLDQEGDEVVDRIRRGLGGARSTPLLHLSGAEAIRALERAGTRRRVFVTDDGLTGDFACRRLCGLQVLDAAGVLAEACTMGDLAWPDATELLKRMAERTPAHGEV